MPEEVNRIMTDHLSDLLFVTEERRDAQPPSRRDSRRTNPLRGKYDDRFTPGLPGKGQPVAHPGGAGVAKRGGEERVSQRRTALCAVDSASPVQVDNRETFLSIWKD